MTVKKQRLDKYYYLAKEKGYRSRASFKLQELNKKYKFLTDVHIAVDLCAAPGGWMQILLQEMQQPRKVIGIDLDFIKPLGNDAISFIGDITTVECRRTLLELLDGNQADIFVHDGAPNFGTSKEKDTFVQNDLVLQALKLTSEFLKKGGAFVTKVFRSENFLKIIKILEGLFEKVNVTKPLSSRNESAEIFIVCSGFLSPDYIDGKLFDSNIVFSENEDNADNYKKILLSDFIRSNSKKILQESGSIIVDFECPLIDDEIKEMFKDLKLVHPNDFKKIYNKKVQIIRGIKSGKYDIDVLSDLNVAIKESEEEEEYNKLDELEMKVNKMKREEYDGEEASNTEKIINYNFYDDQIFDDFDSKEYSIEEEKVEEIEVSSCSDSLSMTESEMRCIIQMKEDGIDKFEADTVDRYLVEDGDIVLENEKRSIKINTPKIEKKKIEVLSRKKARALRRADKKMGDIMLENEEEEAIVHKKIFKNNMKKERRKIKLMFGNKMGARFIKPKINGKVLFVDRRMKHDLRIQKRRMKSKKR